MQPCSSRERRHTCSSFERLQVEYERTRRYRDNPIDFKLLQALHERSYPVRAVEGGAEVGRAEAGSADVSRLLMAGFDPSQEPRLSETCLAACSLSPVACSLQPVDWRLGRRIRSRG